MAENNYGNAVSTATAIGVAAILLKKQVADGTVSIPQSLIDLIMAMGADLDIITQFVQNFQQGTGGGTYQGWPPNTPDFYIDRRDFVAVNTAFQLDDLTIPDDFELLIKSWPTNPAGSLLYIGTTKANAENPLASYPLIPNEFRSFKIQNAQKLWVSTSALPAAVSISVEKR